MSLFGNLKSFYRSLRKACSKPGFTKHLFLSFLILINTFIFPLEPAHAQGTTFTLVNISTSGTGTFTNPSAGAFTVNGAGGQTTNGAGTGISLGTTDSFTYVYLKTSGNVEMRTKLDSQQNTSAFAQAGLMIRESLSNNAAHATITASPLNGVNFLSRASTGAKTTTTLGQPKQSPEWMRIVKSGNSIAAYTGTGSFWNLVGKTQLTMSQPFYIGFAVASNADPTLSTAQFSYSVFMRDVPQRSADMLLWLRADAGVNFGGSFPKIAKWEDQSGNLNDATQSNSSNQPIHDYLFGINNGLLPVVDFANQGSGNSWFQLPNNFSDFANGISIFVVAKPPGSITTDARYVDFGEAASNDNVQLYQPTTSGLTFRVYDGIQNTTVTNASSMSNGEFRLAEAIHDGHQLASLYAQSSLKSTNNAMKNIQNVPRDGNFIAKAYGNNNFFEGKIAEILVFKRGLSDVERKSVESYFYYKYGTPIVTPAPGPLPPKIGVQKVTTPPEPVAPIVTPGTGVYANSSKLIMTADPLVTEIRYTLDGSAPGPSSTIYVPGSEPVLNNGDAKIVRAIAIESGVQSTDTTEYVQIDSNGVDVSRVGLNLWLKADLGVTQSGGNVSHWPDISGHGMHATQTTGANQPTFSTGAINGLPAITFSGSSRWLQMPTDFSSFPQGASIFLVSKTTSTTNNSRYLDFGNGTISDNIQVYETSSGANFTYRVYSGATNTTVSGSATNNSWNLLEIVQDGTSASVYTNGVAGTPNTSMNAIPSTDRTGNFIGKANNAANYFTGQIAEVIIYNRPVTADEKRGIEAYVKARYNLGVNPTLPAPFIQPYGVFTSGNPPIPVSITATNGATIYYTHGLNPPDPTVAPQNLYTAPFTVTSTETIKAIAVKTNFTNSPIGISNIIVDPTTGIFDKQHLKVWLRSDVQVLTTGTSPPRVYQWSDFSGNGNHATQPNPLDQPSLTANSVPTVNLPAVTFSSSSSEWMQFAPGFADFTQGMAIFVVMKHKTGGSTDGRFIDFGNNISSDNIQFGETSASNYKFSVLTGATATDVTANNMTTTYQVLEAMHDGTTNASTLRNGTQSGSNSAMNPITNVNRTGNFLGKAFGTNANVLNADIAEVLIFDRNLQTSERTKVEQYLIARYALITPLNPTIYPSTGAWPAQTPIIITAQPGAQILYSIDGTDPPVLTYDPLDPPKLSSSTTVKAKAILNGVSSPGVTSNYIQIDTNTLNLPRPSMMLWLKADDTHFLIKDGSQRISQWSDASGAGNHFTQGTLAKQPTWVSSAINGLPAVNFSGSDQWFQFVNGMADFTEGFTAFLVVKPPTSPGADARFFDFGSGATSNNIIYSQPSSTSSQFWVYDGGTVSSMTASPSVTANQFQLLELNHTGRQAASMHNTGVQTKIAAIRNINNINRSGNFIGKNNGSGNYFSGQMSEMIIYNRSLTRDEMKSVEQYLAGRYALVKYGGATAAVISPNIEPSSGVFKGGTEVTISAFPGATIKYTTDGTNPHATNGTTYTLPFKVYDSTQIRAVAIQGANLSSVTSSFVQIAPPADPVARDGLVMWYKSDFGLENGLWPASFWKDMSGNGYDAFAGDLNFPFTVISENSNVGFPYVETLHDGTDRSLFMNALSANLVSGFTIFVVTRPQSTSGTESHLLQFSNGASSDNVIVKNNPSQESAGLKVRPNQSTFDTVSSGVGTLPNNKFKLVECLQNGTGNNGKVYIDGVQQGSATVRNANDITRLFSNIGISDAANSLYTGDFAEILVYNRLLSDAERVTAEVYLAQKYQLPNLSIVTPPVVNPAGATLAAPPTIYMAGPTGAKIYFTTNGSTPTVNSTEYKAPFKVTFTQTIKAIAVLHGITSSVSSQTYTLNSSAWPSPDFTDPAPLPQIQLELPTNAIPQ